MSQPPTRPPNGHRAAEAHDPQRHDLAPDAVVEILLQHGRQRRDDREVDEAEAEDDRVGRGREAQEPNIVRKPANATSPNRVSLGFDASRTPCRSTARR